MFFLTFTCSIESSLFFVRSASVFAIEPVTTSIVLAWAARAVMALAVGAVVLYVTFLTIETVVNWYRKKIPVRETDATVKTIVGELENGNFGIVTQVFDSDGDKIEEEVWEAESIEDGVEDIDVDYV